MGFGFVRATTVPKESNMSKDAKSTLYVRIASELHRRARVRALTDGVNLAEVVEAALLRHLAVETAGATP